MKTSVFAAASLACQAAVFAALVTLFAIAPVHAASYGQLPATFLDQGSQAPSFPGSSR